MWVTTVKVKVEESPEALALELHHGTGGLRPMEMPLTTTAVGT